MISDIIIILIFKNVYFQIFLSIWTIAQPIEENWFLDVLSSLVYMAAELKKKGKDWSNRLNLQ